MPQSSGGALTYVARQVSRKDAAVRIAQQLGGLFGRVVVGGWRGFSAQPIQILTQRRYEPFGVIPVVHIRKQ